MQANNIVCPKLDGLLWVTHLHRCCHQKFAAHLITDIESMQLRNQCSKIPMAASEETGDLWQIINPPDKFLRSDDIIGL